MKITAAHAIYENRFHPMYPSSDPTTTALIRLGRRDGENGGWTPSTVTLAEGEDGTWVNEWMEDSNQLLSGLKSDGAGPYDEPGIHVLDNTTDDTEIPANDHLKFSPWYTVFWARDPMDGALEVWAGRFVLGSDAPDETTQDQAGVYYFRQAQKVKVAPGTSGPVMEGIEAFRSYVFASYGGAAGATSKAKEQGCSVDDDELRFTWPTHG